MISIVVSLVVALLVAAGATPLVRRFALVVGAVDSPTARRVHSRRVPRLGGSRWCSAFSSRCFCSGR